MTIVTCEGLQTPQPGMESSHVTKFADFDRTDLVYCKVADHNLYASVLRPRRTEPGTRSSPVLVFWHGGGFTTGDRMYEPWWPTWMIQLAKSEDAMIISPDFRLMPEAGPSDVLDDVASFWTWYTSTLPNLAASESWDVQPDIKRTICAGQSSGAVIGVHSALEHPEVQIRAILALYGPLCFDVPLLSMPKPRAIGGSKPQAPRQAEATIRSYVARNKGLTRTSGNPADDWELVAAMVQQGWLPRLVKRNPDPRLDVVANLRVKRVLPPMWVVHGEQDSVVPVECAIRFSRHASETVPNTPFLLSTRPGEHTFDVNLTTNEPWIGEGCNFIRTHW